MQQEGSRRIEEIEGNHLIGIEIIIQVTRFDAIQYLSVWHWLLEHSMKLNSPLICTKIESNSSPLSYFLFVFWPTYFYVITLDELFTNLS